MAKKKKDTVVASYNLYVDQKAWIDEQADKHGISATDVVRELVKKEMEKQSVAS
jgi:hypothetical protein